MSLELLTLISLVLVAVSITAQTPPTSSVSTFSGTEVTRVTGPAATEYEADVLTAARGLESALVRNDANEISGFLDDEWVIVGPDGVIIDKTRFLNVIKSGTLVHEAMNSEDIHVRVYGTTAIVTALTSSKARYQNNEFSTRERSTDVFVKRTGKWRCVMTHLTTFAPK